jgi:hypothetical protein
MPKKKEQKKYIIRYPNINQRFMFPTSEAKDQNAFWVLMKTKKSNDVRVKYHC